MVSILLTGGSGFIGKNFLELFSNTFNITAPSHKELDLMNAWKVKEYFKNRKFDVVVHAASIGSLHAEQNATGVYEANMYMLRVLAENASNFRRMIFFGSGAEYGKQRSIIKVKENDFGRILPEDEYGRSKYAASEYIDKHDHIINLRCFGVFGKYEDYTTRFISNIICQSLADQPIVIKQNTIFDYVHITDLARILSFFIKHEPRDKFYNVGRGEGLELMTIARIVKQLTNNAYDIQVKISGMGKEYTCDNSNLLRELGGFRFTPIQQSIQEMVEWYKMNWYRIDQSKLTINF